MSIKSQKDYLFKKSAQKLLTDEMYEDIEDFATSNKDKAEYEYPNNIKLVMTRVEIMDLEPFLLKMVKKWILSRNKKEGC